MKAFVKYYIKDRLDLFWSKARLRLSKKTPILVFTMAKVGSLSVYSSIKKQTSTPCFHVHTLNVSEDLSNQKACFDKGVYPNSRSSAFLISNDILKPEKPFKIISLFRDPIERNISAFFDAFKLYVGVPVKQYNGGIDNLINCFHEKLPHEYATLWFKQQFERDTSINLYDTDFNVNDGFQHYTKKNCEILLMNSNIDNSLKTKLIADFISEKSFRLNNVNITSETDKNELYQNFKKTIRFDKVYLDSLLNSEYCQHFFSEEYIQSCYKKWLI